VSVVKFVESIAVRASEHRGVIDIVPLSSYWQQFGGATRRFHSVILCPSGVGNRCTGLNPACSAASCI